MSLRARTSSPSGARQRDLVESIILLAGLSQLVIVDITDPRFTPMELHAIVPNFAVQVVPIMKKGTGSSRSPQVSLGRRPPIEYENPGQLVGELDELLTAPYRGDAVGCA
jgi:hypothetical protein